MRVPELKAENDRIELDQITVMVKYIHQTFKDAYGEAPDVNDWDACRVRDEMECLFSPDEFTRLFQTEFGRGVLVGAWIYEFIMGEDYDEELDA
jgi:hypothetical protein